MEPLPFRSIINPAAMALSESSSEEQEDPSIFMFATECPLDYCSRTSIQLSFSCASSKAGPKRMAHLLKTAHATVFGDRYPRESEMVQKYLLSNRLVVTDDNGSDTINRMTIQTDLPSTQTQILDTDINDGNEACGNDYTSADIVLIMRKILNGLVMYVSISGSALYARPYNIILDDLFHISQLQQKAASSYIDRQLQNNKHATRSIIADICAYRKALIDCYEHISEAQFVVVLGSSFEALFGCHDSSERNTFCMVSGYPGIIESLEYVLKDQSKVRRKLKTVKETFQHASYKTYRDGSSIYISGDITLVIHFFLYGIPLGIGLHSIDKSLPQIHSTRPFECSYQNTNIACTIDEDSTLLSIDCYMPFFSVKQVLEGLHSAVTAISKEHQILVELNTPTQHSRSFNYLNTLCTNEATPSASPKTTTSGTYSFIKQLRINSKGFVSYY